MIHLTASVCFGDFRPTREFFNHTIIGEGLKILTCLGTHGNWVARVLSVPHPLWQGASVYSGHLRGPVTLSPIAERLAGELSLPVSTTRSVAAGIRTHKLLPTGTASESLICILQIYLFSVVKYSVHFPDFYRTFWGSWRMNTDTRWREERRTWRWRRGWSSVRWRDRFRLLQTSGNFRGELAMYRRQCLFEQVLKLTELVMFYIT